VKVLQNLSRYRVCGQTIIVYFVLWMFKNIAKLQLLCVNIRTANVV